MVKKKGTKLKREKIFDNNELIKNHILIQKVKLFFSIGAFVICILLLILSAILPKFDIDGKVLGWITVGAAMVLASSQIKTLKDIINFK